MKDKKKPMAKMCVTFGGIEQLIVKSGLDFMRKGKENVFFVTLFLCNNHFPLLETAYLK